MSALTKCLTVIFMLTLFSIRCFAGGQNGNGGGGHECGNDVELYDFYEGRNPLLHNIKVWQSDPGKTVKDYVDLAMIRLNKEFPEVAPKIKKVIDELLAKPYNEIVLPVTLPPTKDADIFIVDEGCKYTQVANWNDRFNRVIFSRRPFELMNNMSKAGLYVHESLYRSARIENNLKDTDILRKVVAQIFSDDAIDRDDFLSLFISIPVRGLVNRNFPDNGKCEVKIEAESSFSKMKDRDYTPHGRMHFLDDNSKIIFEVTTEDVGPRFFPCRGLKHLSSIIGYYSYRYSGRNPVGVVNYVFTVGGIVIRQINRKYDGDKHENDYNYGYWYETRYGQAFNK